MAMWTEGKKALFVGASGLQFQPEVVTDRPVVELRRLVAAFYEARGAAFVEPSNEKELKFTRGRKIVGKLSWLLFLSEKWAYHHIAISLSEKEGAATVSITYNAWLYFSLVVKPNFFEKEVQALRAELVR